MATKILNAFEAFKAGKTTSLFVGDRAFTAQGKSGKSLSQLGTERVRRETKQTGRNPGSLRALSKKGGTA